MNTPIKFDFYWHSLLNSTQSHNHTPNHLSHYPPSQYPLAPLLNPPDLEMLKVDKSHKISICVPYKAGSETWRYLLRNGPVTFLLTHNKTKIGTSHL